MVDVIERQAEAFGIETSPAVAWIFYDDAVRFADVRQRCHAEASRRAQKQPRREMPRDFGET